MADEENSDLLTENLNNINNINLRIILVSNASTIAIFLFSLLGLFEVSSHFCLLLFIYSSITALLYFILLKCFKSRPRIASFFGLLILEGYLTFAGSNIDIGIYMTFSLIPFVASLYYSKKLTCAINISCYFFMLASLYFKWKGGGSIFINTVGKTGIFATYVPVVMGFTIESTVVFIVSMQLTKRNFNLFTRLSSGLKKIQISHKQIKAKNVQLENTQIKIIGFVAECLGSHDLFTGRHVIHTKEFVNMICLKMREMKYYENILTDENISIYTNAAFLHDIGKIHIPEGILNKTGKFTDKEFERMKSHAAEGRKLLEFLPKIDNGKFNEIAIQMAYCHHEKWNGTGYPRRIAGIDIPLCARIMSAADVLDALISQRLYKTPMSIDQAMKVFEDSKGSHFEPCIADAVIACKDQIIEIDQRFKEEESAEYNEELEWWHSYHQEK